MRDVDQETGKDLLPVHDPKALAPGMGLKGLSGMRVPDGAEVMPPPKRKRKKITEAEQVCSSVSLFM
jgi:hypothetical protein